MSDDILRRLFEAHYIIGACVALGCGLLLLWRSREFRRKERVRVALYGFLLIVLGLAAAAFVYFLL